MWGRRGRVNLVDTPELASFFDRLDHLNQAQLLAMRAAWRSISREAHEEAWAAVRAVGAREGLAGEIARVRNKALRWATRGNNSIPYQLVDDLDWLQIKADAGEAIVDAALAVALGSRLDDETRARLIGPWIGTVQSPG